jgi:hypothetical protein
MTDKQRKYKYPAAVGCVQFLFVAALVLGLVAWIGGATAGGMSALGFVIYAGGPGLILFVAALFGSLVIAIVRASRKEGWQAQLETNQESEN